MVKILLLQGANLTFLGRREPEIYGSTTPADLDAMLRRHAHDHAYQLEIFYTNIEGEAINRIYQAVDEGFDGLVMNPAGFTYAGFALKGCIKGAGLPYVEVHISSIAKRNVHCVLSDVAEGIITGFGIHSYILGLDAMLEGAQWDADMLVPATTRRPSIRSVRECRRQWTGASWASPGSSMGTSCFSTVILRISRERALDGIRLRRSGKCGSSIWGNNRGSELLAGIQRSGAGPR